MNHVDDMNDVLARVRRKVIDRLSKADDPVIAEMAREIRAGRITAREAMSVDAYAEVVQGAGRATVSRIAAMPAEEREALAERGREALDEQEALDEAEERAASRARPVVDEPVESIMVRASARPATPPGGEPTGDWARPPRSVRDRSGRRGR